MIQNKLLNLYYRKRPHELENYARLLETFYPSKIKKKIALLKFWKDEIGRYGLDVNVKNSFRNESSVYIRPKWQHCYDILSQYDYISFDVFDTLILRNVMYPSDVFYLVGIKLNLSGFREMRELAEKEALRRKPKEEINIYDIYEVLNQWYGINIEEGIKAEVETEVAICTFNPYWKEIFLKLTRETNKTIVISTDMYLREQDIRKILNSNGYEWKGKIFVSSEIGKSKKNGLMYQFIREEIGICGKCIHVGDNIYSDINEAKRNGWNTLYYRDVHSIGEPYRERGRSILIESIVGGILNCNLHNGIMDMTPREEFGFHYFGSIYVGYCQWLNKLAKEKKIEKFLFLSRDCYLLKEVYENYYKEIDCEYVVVSRYALSQISFLENIELFIKQNVYPRIKEKCTLEEILYDLELEGLQDKLTIVGLKKSEILSENNFDKFRLFLISLKSNISEKYEQSVQAARLYISQIVANYSTVCVVDVGWHGTCTMTLTNFIHKHINENINILGAHLGTECSDSNIEMFASGTINSYAFSPLENYDIYLRNDFKASNLIAEIAFSAPHASLRKYSLNEKGQVEFIYMDEAVQNYKIVGEIQNGINKFVKTFHEIETGVGKELYIPGRVAYVMFSRAIKEKKHLKEMFGDYIVCWNVTSKKATQSIKDIIY